MDKFTQWLDTYIIEKSIDTHHSLEVQGPSGLNYIPLTALVDAIKAAPAHEQKGIKNMLVQIDFNNGDPIHYFTHLAQAIAI